MNDPTELAHMALILGFAVMGAIGLPAVLLIFVQMMLGQSDGVGLRPRR